MAFHHHAQYPSTITARPSGRTVRDDSEGSYFLNVEDTHTFNQPEGSVEFKGSVENMNAVKDELLIPLRCIPPDINTTKS